MRFIKSILTLLIIASYVAAQEGLKIKYPTDFTGLSKKAIKDTIEKIVSDTANILRPEWRSDISDSIAGIGAQVLNYQAWTLVAQSGGKYSSIQSAINSFGTMKADSQAIIEIIAGIYSVDSLVLKDYVNLVGTGEVVIRNNSTSLTQWIINGTNVHSTLMNLKIKGRNCLKARGTSDLKFVNVDFMPRDADLANYYCRLYLFGGANCSFYDCNLIESSSMTYKTLIEDNSRLNWYGGNIDAQSISFEDQSQGYINCNKLRFPVTGGISIGHTNPYNSSITGTDGNWADTSAAGYADYKLSNDSCTARLYLQFQNADSINAWVNTYQKGQLYLANSNLSSERGFLGIGVYNSAFVRIDNSIVGKLSTMYGDHRIECYNSKIIYDKDLIPSGDTSVVYNASYWPYYAGGTHCMESSRTYNTKLIPTLKLRNCTVEYMGDDVINSLPENQALKEMEANPQWIFNSMTRPDSSSIFGSSDWVTSTSYSIGDKRYYGNNLYICTTAHTSGTFLTDLRANKWHMFVTAWRTIYGYYQFAYLHKINGWTIFYTLGEWHGGKYRNRGNPAVFYFCNVDFDKVDVIRYASIFTWNSFINLSDYLSGAYATVFALYANRVIKMNQVNIYNIGNSYNNVTGLGYTIEDSLTNKDHRLNNISVIGEDILYGTAFDFNNLIADDSSMLAIDNIHYLHTNADSNYLYITNFPAGWSGLRAWRFATGERENISSYLGGNLQIDNDLIAKGNTSYGDALIRTTMPVQMNYNAPSDTTLITFNYRQPMNSGSVYTGYSRIYFEFYLYTHMYGVANNYAGLMEIKVAATGAGTGNSTGITKTVLLTNNLNPNWNAPTAAQITYYSSSATQVILAVTSTSSNTNTYLWVKMLYSENIKSISLKVQ